MLRRLIVFPLLLLGACATPQNNYDPLEPINRPIYKMNKAVDDAVLRPVAKGYVRFVPPPLRKGVDNFFENIDDLFSIPAALLQGKATPASKSFGRVLVNSTVGVGGLIDWASDLPIEKQNQDLGQTLGYWGLPTGPYLMVPFYGPTTLRDSVEPLSRFIWGPIDYVDDLAGQITYYSVYIVNARAQILPLDKIIDEQADPYAFIRDSYLQRRWFKIHDGNPPFPLPMGSADDLDADAGPEAAPIARAPSAVTSETP
ncbi:MlaA family lipoprotein [Deefgea piscis]|uniref:MlaA family lipoprotein n=1 Tax=Deefgea piscis TaxID=2739061 RepID=UPI001C813092|nr:VacJ family lipoprotein [Deefgea piscis]QZA81165.1 VacJ family lipoprotein [Deefgea piscis]